MNENRNKRIEVPQLNRLCAKCRVLLTPDKFAWNKDRTLKTDKKGKLICKSCST